MTQFDEFLHDAEVARQVRRRDAQTAAALTEWDAALQKAHEELAEVRRWNAGNMGKLAAALKQIEKLDPTNPLVRDTALRARIGDFAAAAFEKANDWDVAREVGRTFSIPGRS